ncbi:MAG: sporulation protein YabP [Oscillospiraceae bacterium]|jgi:sporulation protein YabP|nr:sporulation protein YabP [Oscillospiraceae bacterium]
MAEDFKAKNALPPKGPHHLILEERRLLSVSGVEDIDSFDEQTVVLFTNKGELTVKGESLHINRLNVDTGELNVEGEIHTLIYSDDEPRQKSLFSKIFK